MKVLIATPCYGGQVHDLYMRSIIALIHSGYARGVQVDVLAQSGESLITRARNDIVSTFWEGDWTDLVFIDSDIGFDPENLWRLLDSPHGVCASPYPLKKLPVRTVINRPLGEVRSDGFVPVLDAGTGFMRISREALTQMLASYPELKYEAEGGGVRWAVFDTLLDTEVKPARYLSEDYAFCRRWQRIGGEVMVDTLGPKLTHRGYLEYREEDNVYGEGE